MKAYIEDLLNRNFIKKSSSSYSEQRKKYQSIRLCVDFRALNKKTRPDRHPIPRIQEMLDNLNGLSWFSVLDQGKAYYQEFMSSNSQPLTAFITHWGLYEWVRIPFGLSRAPGSFQRFMENCLGDLRDSDCVPYLDDIIIFSATFEDHIENRRKVLRRLKKHRVKLKPRKCKLFEREVTFLRRIVSKEGYKLDPSSIKLVALRDSPPKTVNEVCRLMGFLNYYRRCVRDFSRIANPIYDLVKTRSRPPQEVKRDKSTKERSDNGQLPAKHWHSSICLADSYWLNQKCSSNGVSWPTETICSPYRRLKGWLRRRVVSVSGWHSPCCRLWVAQLDPKRGELPSLSREIGISTPQMGYLHQFRDYLYYAPNFKVFTENNPPIYVLSSAKLNATSLRWIGELADFNFTIHYRPRKASIDADALSRMPSVDTAYTEIVPQYVLQAAAWSAKSQDQGQVNWVSTLTGDHTVLPTDPLRSEESTGPRIDLKYAQATDQVVRRVSDLIRRGQRPPEAERKRELSET